MDKKKGHLKAALNRTYNHNDNTAKAQRQRLLDFLVVWNSITTIEARRELDIMMPAARIHELRQQGCKIDTVWTSDITEQGKQHRVARYVWRMAA
ncbi:hypothetical protein LG202_10700 [Methylobacillus methanolivorans]